MGKLVRVEGPNFVAGMATKDGKVTETAPILGRYKGKDTREVAKSLRDRGFHYQVMDDPKGK